MAFLFFVSIFPVAFFAPVEWKGKAIAIIFCLMVLLVIIAKIPSILYSFTGQNSNSPRMWLLPIAFLLIIVSFGGIIFASNQGIPTSSILFSVLGVLGVVGVLILLGILYSKMGNTDFNGIKSGTPVYVVYRDMFIEVAKEKNLTTTNTSMPFGGTQLQMVASGQSKYGTLQLSIDSGANGSRDFIAPVSAIQLSTVTSMPNVIIYGISQDKVMLDDIQSKLGVDASSAVEKYVSEHKCIMGGDMSKIYLLEKGINISYNVMLNKKEWLDQIDFAEFLVSVATAKIAS